MRKIIAVFLFALGFAYFIDFISGFQPDQKLAEQVWGLIWPTLLILIGIRLWWSKPIKCPKCGTNLFNWGNPKDSPQKPKENKENDGK